MKLLFFLLAFFTISMAVPCFAQDAPPDKKTGPESYKERTFNKKEITGYREDPDFKYARPPKFDPIKRGIMARINEWINDFFDSLTEDTWTMIQYIIIALALGFVIYYIRKATITGTVGNDSSGASIGEFQEENIHAIDFNKALREAIAAQEFRLATRLYFLMTLKALDDRNLIRHGKDKTNREYLKELKSGTMRDDFRFLIRSFEFIWYGNTQPGQALFQQVQSRYAEFLNRVEQSKTK